MANRKINELSVRTPSLTDLMIVGDPSTGYSFKATLAALNSLIVNTNVSINDLSGVSIVSPTTNQVLQYDGTNWVNATLTDNGITSLNGLTALSQTFATGTSGTDFAITSTTSTHTFNLPTASAVNRGALSSADWSTFNSKVGGSGTSGQVAYWTGTSSQSGSNNLFWDAANNRLGIGTTTPEHRLDVNNGKVRFINSSTQEFDLSGQTNLSRLQINNTWFFLGSLTAHPLVFGTSANERMRIFATGNVGINTGSTDGGQRLQVTGDVLFKGSGNTIASTALIVQNSAATNMFSVRNDQNILINAQTNFGNVQFYPVNNGGYTLSPTGTELRMETSFVNGVTTGGFGFALGTYSAHNTSAPNAIGTTINGSFSPTSGTKTYTQLVLDPTINQTGGANGVTIGLRINPTLTSAADWRSIQWDNNSGWGLYGAGTSNNYLAGSLGIGSTILTNYTIRSQKAITGGIAGYGIMMGGQIQSDVTAVASYYRTAVSTQAASFTLSELHHFLAEQGTFGASSVVTNQYGFVADATLIGATNNYGFRGNIPSGTGRWNLYMNGTANNYLAGKLGLGTTDLTSSSFRVRVAITGSTLRYNIVTDGVIQSDVTNAARYFSSISQTQAASFSIGSIFHYTAEQGTIGAGSSISEQNGFYVYSSMTGATNNFGFRGDIASGTGRWNIYMSGTAANYMNGNLLLGSTVDGGQKLQVTGNAIVKGTMIVDNTSFTGPDLVISKIANSTHRITGGPSENITFGPSNRIFLNTSEVAVSTSMSVGVSIVGNIPNSTGLLIKNNSLVQNNDTRTGLTFQNTSWRNDGAGGTSTINAVQISPTVDMTVGTTTGTVLLLNPTINTTGGTSTLRGLYYNPTLTSLTGATHIAIQTVSGNVLFGTTSGSVGVGTSTINASAILELSSTTKGFLPPKGTNAQMLAIATPVSGLVFYDTTNNKLNVYDGTNWVAVH